MMSPESIRGFKSNIVLGEADPPSNQVERDLQARARSRILPELLNKIAE